MTHVDPAPIISMSRHNDSNQPVTTARYIVEVVMNEEMPQADRTPEEHLSEFAAELQRALDCRQGHFVQLRYDALTFEVISREVLDVAPAGDPE